MNHLIQSNAKNMDGECANLRCGFRLRGVPTKARYYHLEEKSWVCSCCAQSINIKALQRAARYPALGGFKKVCITTEDALVLILSEGKVI